MNDSLNIYEEYEISSDSDTNSIQPDPDDESEDDDFHNELLASWKEEEGESEGKQKQFRPKIPTLIWKNLPRDLVFRVLNSTLPLECRLCSKTLCKAQQASQRGRTINVAISKLCIAESPIKPLSKNFVMNSEIYLYNKCSQILTNLYSSTMRAFLTSLQLVRTSGGSSGPSSIYTDILENKISSSTFVDGIIDNSINLLGSKQTYEINTILANRKRDRTILQSRTSAAQADSGIPWLEECGKCGSAETFYNYRKRKTDVDRYRIVVWCNSCKMAYEL
ncbi:hypothetical protein TL16_g09090 [Triparma laevis f. inornata]|uniref:Uncharacterized protein n=2 Tax=Triparma laevis TaxID=1534972 RepID=A0A9W7A2B1_9STRA|nr:hypothetical protein TrLO_g1497 [Triparma laevis f. longispina]GMH81922.1 hypothetical protein TL16_g09090 [Triparma laevis f. inornata]